jgi:aminoglycoside phosphotransferase (APT) family kinase protein
MHDDELVTDADLVRRLVASQFPSWSEEAIVPLPAGGTDNAIYRLGAALAVRLPRRRDAEAAALDRELAGLERLGPHLPFAVPTPVARGVPGEGYPNGWSVHRWLDGDDATTAPIDLARASADLVRLLAALRGVDTAGGPAPGGRGGPLAPRDGATRAGIAALADEIDVDAATAVWDAAVTAPAWAGPPVWIHGDLDARNLVVREGRITGILDWGALCVGDPACDLKVAFAVLDRHTRPAFRDRLAVDDASWARARGWAVSQAVIALPYYRDTYPGIVTEARRWLAEALAPA